MIPQMEVTFCNPEKVTAVGRYEVALEEPGTHFP